MNKANKEKIITAITFRPALNLGLVGFWSMDDEVRVYNRALTAGEIQQLYNMGI